MDLSKIGAERGRVELRFGKLLIGKLFTKSGYVEHSPVKSLS